MSGNSKQPAAGGQQMRYSSSYQSMPQSRESFQLPGQNYVQTSNQGGNQGAGLRGIPQPGPPNQAPTPPNQDLKVAQQPPMSLYPQQNQVRQQAFYRQPGPPPPNQTPRMPNNQHRGQQQMYQANPQTYVQMPLGTYPMVFYTGQQRQSFVQQQPVLLPGPTYPYTFQSPTIAQTQPITYQYIQQMQPRPGPPPPQHPASTLSNPNQPPLQAMSLTQTMAQPQQTTRKPNRKRPNALAVIDPLTGLNTLDDLFPDDNSHPPSGESSARQTPQPAPQLPNKDVQVAFHKQVTQKLSEDDAIVQQQQQRPVVLVQQQQQQQQYSMEQHHHQHQLEEHRMRNQTAGPPDMVPSSIPYHHAPPLPPTQQQQQQQLSGHVIAAGGVAKMDHIVQTSSLKAQAPEFVLTVKEPTVAVSAPAVKEPPVVSALTDGEEVTLQPGKQQHHQQHHHQKGRESPVKGRKKETAAPTPLAAHHHHQQQQQQHHKASADATTPSVVVGAAAKDDAPPAKPNKEPEQQKTKVVAEETTEKRRKETTVAKVTTTTVTEERKGGDVAAETSQTSGGDAETVNAKTKNSSQRKDSQKGGAQKSGAGPNVPPPQPAKSNSKTSKKNELNNKGASKEGTDMDVFQSSDQLNANNNVQTINNQNKQPQITTITQQQQQQVVDKDDVTNANVEQKNVPAATAPVPTTTMPIVANDVKKNDNEDAAPVPNSTVTAPVPAPTIRSKVNVTDVFGENTVFPTAQRIQPSDNRDETDRASAFNNDRLIQAKNEMNAVKSALDDKKSELSYKQGQWSPSCPDGDKTYDIEFLMALRNTPNSTIKPSHVPDFLLSNSDNRQQRQPENRYARNDYGNNLFPGFGKNSSMKGSQSITKHNSLSGKSNNKGGKSTNGATKISISLKEDIKLHETENAWKPGRLAKVDTRTEEEKKAEDLYKKVRSVLNKLTPQKFDTLLKQIKELKIETHEHLQGVINLIFEKAIDEPNFSVAYARMCRELSTLNVNTGKEKLAVFKTLLINRCQEEFEKQSKDEHRTNEKMTEIEQCTDAEKKKELEFELEDIIRRLRMRSVGNIRFIGELFKIQMLTSSIMSSCLTQLLSNKDEDSLECLCKLLSTIGKALEESRDGKDLNKFFNTMQDIVDRKNSDVKVSSRIRFMLQDVIDLRKSKWVPRRQDMNPKTIDQIQKEAENEQINQSLNNSVQNTPRKDEGQMSSKGGAMGGRQSRMPDTDGWVVSRTQPRPFVVHRDKLKSKPVVMEDEQLGGAQLFHSWGKGSQFKGQSPASNVGMMNTTNKFSVLDNSSSYESDKKSGGYSSRMGGYNSKGNSLERSSYGGGKQGYDSRSGSQHRSMNNNNNSSNEQQQYQQHSQQQSLMQQQQQQQQQVTSSSSMHRAQAPSASAANSPYVNQSQQQEKDAAQSQTTQQQPAEAAGAQMTEVQLERYFKNILDEYIGDNCTAEECDEDISRKIPVNYMARMVSDGYLSNLEKFDKARLRTGTLFAKLLKSGTLPLKAYCAGLEDIFNQFEDLIIDIPKIWDYLAQSIAPVICEKMLPFDRLRYSCALLIERGYADKLLASTFKLIVSEKGPNFLRDLWLASRVKLEEFVAPQKVDAFVEENKLQFLNGAEPSRGDSDLNYEQIENKLREFFASNASFDDITSWITANVGEKTEENKFVRTLATAIYKDSIVNSKLIVERLSKHYKLFQKYVDGIQSYELQCLYALQSLSTKLEHPQGLLLSIFSQLSEDSILSQESFNAWEKSQDPAEQEGKGVVVLQLTSFFTQLRENDDCEEDDELSSGGDN